VKLLFLAKLVTVSACCAASANAATGTASIAVSVMVEASCQASVSAAEPARLSAARTVTPWKVRVQCTNSTPVNVDLSAPIPNREATGPRRSIASHPDLAAAFESCTGIVSGVQTTTHADGNCSPNHSSVPLSVHGEVWDGSCFTDGRTVQRITFTY
jgi:hypothetical protein